MIGEAAAMRAAPDAREAEIASFLRRAGWQAAARAPLAGDASPRRYERLSGGPRPAVLMDAPPDLGEDVRPFAALTGLLRDRGFAAPDIYACDTAAGLLLLEDVGDALFARVCAATPEAEAELYEAAVDLLVALHAAPPPGTALGYDAAHPIGPYSELVLLREARLVVDWWAPAAGRRLSSAALAEFDALVAEACARPSRDRSALVLRDYHAENLIWDGAAEGLARVRPLDYQDAVAGSAAYDLVSLLEDARRDVPDGLRAAMTARYAAAARAADPDFDAEAFAADAAALAAQRNLKIMGVFARLARRDGKPRYLPLIPRVWGHLRRDLAHPDLAALRVFVERWIPEPDDAALAAAAS